MARMRLALQAAATAPKRQARDTGIPHHTLPIQTTGLYVLLMGKDTSERFSKQKTPDTLKAEEEAGRGKSVPCCLPMQQNHEACL